MIKLLFQLLWSHVALKSTKAELLHFQEMSKKLQNFVVTTQNEIEESHKGLEVERNTVNTLQELVKDVKGQLDIASCKVTNTHQQLAIQEDMITNLKQEMGALSNSKEEIARQLQARTSELETEKNKLKEVFIIM